MAHVAARLAGLRDAIVVLPELFLGSYTRLRDAILEPAALVALLAPLEELTRGRRLALVGSAALREGGRAVNAVVVVEGGATRLPGITKQRPFGP